MCVCFCFFFKHYTCVSRRYITTRSNYYAVRQKSRAASEREEEEGRGEGRWKESGLVYIILFSIREYSICAINCPSRSVVQIDLQSSRQFPSDTVRIHSRVSMPRYLNKRISLLLVYYLSISQNRIFFLRIYIYFFFSSVLYILNTAAR